MQETYFVQSALRYWKSYMLPVPDDFQIHPDYLLGSQQDEFIGGFKQLHAIVSNIYEDMRQDPARYGLPLFEIEKFRKHSKEKNASHHAVFRLGNLFYNLGQAGELVNHELVVNLERFKSISKDKSVPNQFLILAQLNTFGLKLDGFSGTSFEKGAQIMRIAYPDNPNVMIAFKAFSMTVSPEFHDNRHSICKDFYMFHHRLFSTHTGQPPGSDLSDFFQVVSASKNQLPGAQDINQPSFLEPFHQQMAEKGYTTRFNNSYDWKVDFYKGGKYSYHYCLLQEDDFSLRLKLSLINQYINYLDSCPDRMQQVFIHHPPCQHCRERCALRVEYEYRGVHHEACVCSIFSFFNPQTEDIPHYMRLVELEETI